MSSAPVVNWQLKIKTSPTNILFTEKPEVESLLIKTRESVVGWVESFFNIVTEIFQLLLQIWHSFGLLVWNQRRIIVALLLVAAVTILLLPISFGDVSRISMS